MICKYCNRKIDYEPDNSIWCHCAHCDTEFYRNGTININVTINDKLYYFQYRTKTDNAPPARLIEDGGEILMEFKTAPNITPSNIKEKIKLYLLFS